MSRSDPRLINGQFHYKLYAYFSKDFSHLGVLEAMDYADARRHLGSRYRIKTVWISPDLHSEQMFDWCKKMEIVSEAFPNIPKSAWLEMEREYEA
jgi:hypothetical protein